MLPSVGSGNNLTIPVLSSWHRAIISAHGVVWRNARQEFAPSVVLCDALKCSIAHFSVLAAGDVVLTISPVVVRHMSLAEHSAASLPENWTQESVVGLQVLVLAVTVPISTVGASLSVAFGVWNSNELLTF